MVKRARRLSCNARGILHPDTALVNKSGAGDAMLAAFLAKRDSGVREALRYAGAAGNAAASCERDITLEDVERFLPLMEVKSLA